MWSRDEFFFNHYAYGAIGEWMYRVMAGIDTDEAEEGAGFRHLVIWPRMGGGLSYTDAVHETVYAGPRPLGGQRAQEDFTACRNPGQHQCIHTPRPCSSCGGSRWTGISAMEGFMEANTGSWMYRIVFKQQMTD